MYNCQFSSLAGSSFHLRLACNHWLLQLASQLSSTWHMDPNSALLLLHYNIASTLSIWYLPAFSS
jgi:hypothetical protein